jgi:hypothetical protein
MREGAKASERAYLNRGRSRVNILGCVGLPFWFSIAVLSLVQGALVALAVVRQPLGRLQRLRSRSWALIPAASVVLFVIGVRWLGDDSATVLTYLALVAVPPLAACALAFAIPGARPLLAVLVVPLFALAWADSGGLAGHTAALALSALSCVTLGVLIACVTPRAWLALGIIAMAIADAALVIAELLQEPNNALNAVHPVAGLPRLQAAIFGSAVMGYGDLFIAGALGGLLALEVSRSRQLWTAALTALLALCFDLLFFAVHELPATVPVALALVLLIGWERLSGERTRREAPALQGVTAQGASG